MAIGKRMTVLRRAQIHKGKKKKKCGFVCTCVFLSNASEIYNSQFSIPINNK